MPKDQFSLSTSTSRWPYPRGASPYALSASELRGLIDSGADIAIFDSRSYEEYHNNSIPTAISVPGVELVSRFTDLMPAAASAASSARKR